MMIDEKATTSALNAGFMRLTRHLTVAKSFLEPHLASMHTGRPARLEGGMAATVENLSLAIALSWGWENESYSTLKAKVWGPSKPALHAAYWAMTWLRNHCA